MEISPQDVYRIMLKNYPDILDVKQVSEILGVCSKTVYKLVADGSLPMLKVGRQYRITKVNVLKYMKMLQPSPPGNSAPTK